MNWKNSLMARFSLPQLPPPYSRSRQPNREGRGSRGTRGVDHVDCVITNLEVEVLDKASFRTQRLCAGPPEAAGFEGHRIAIPGSAVGADFTNSGNAEGPAQFFVAHPWIV